METSQFTDSRDNNSYKIVKLNDGKWWFAENLRFAFENSIPADPNPSEELLKQFPRYDSEKFGHLYTWKDANIVCPKGWHLPSRKEWRTMLNLHCGFETDRYERSKLNLSMGMLNSFIKFNFDKLSIYTNEYEMTKNKETTASNVNKENAKQFFLGENTPFNEILGGHYHNGCYQYFQSIVKGCHWTSDTDPFNNLETAYIICFEKYRVVEWTELINSMFPVRCIKD